MALFLVPEPYSKFAGKGSDGRVLGCPICAGTNEIPVMLVCHPIFRDAPRGRRGSGAFYAVFVQPKQARTFGFGYVK